MPQRQMVRRALQILGEYARRMNRVDRGGVAVPVGHGTKGASADIHVRTLANF